MKWSVLDQSPTSAGSGQDTAIRESIALAQHCDALGYERYWVSEHHNSGSIVGTAPEILMAAGAHFGLPYAFAYFFSDGAGVDEALGLYRRNYRPSERYPTPCPTICVWALAADTEQEAQRQATTREYWRAGFEKGERLPLMSPETAQAHIYTPAEQAMIAKLRDNALVGDPRQVADKLNALARRLELEEIVINTWTFDPAVRRHSYALLAQAFGL
jgi:alkanesulfonate monooxygenase SsuD/methylene tetrahydromethanopterin reductase-like flavin-dependent oxidoreductase (luciferase family)